MTTTTDRLVHAWERLVALDPDWEAIAPDVVYVQHLGQHAGEYRGHEGIREWVASMGEVWSDGVAHFDDIREEGDVVHATFHVRLTSGHLDLDTVFRGRLRAELDEQGRVARAEVWDDNPDW